MTCPTCDRAMMNVGSDDFGMKVFWCETCGTLQNEVMDETEPPKLVLYVRHFVGLGRPLPGTPEAYAFAGMADAAGVKEAGQ